MEHSKHKQRKTSWLAGTAAAALPFTHRCHRSASHELNKTNKQNKKRCVVFPPPPITTPAPSFADLPSDLLSRIASAFDVPDLWAASAACPAWRESLRPLREAMVLLRWGKRYKHGGHGFAPDPEKALESFLKGTLRGSAAAMVDAGLMYWDMGKKEQGMEFYRKAAELGYPAGQCNLGICYLEANPAELGEAVKWFTRAANLGYARAQYNLALCLQRGRGIEVNLSDAAMWYLRAAEGGNARAMYNLALCYSLGEGLVKNRHKERMWMKRAADFGHKKAQLEHGLELFSTGDTLKALVYLELASRAGEIAALHARDAIQSLSQSSRESVMLAADRWKPVKLRR